MSELQEEVEAVQPEEGQGQPVAEGSEVQPGEGQGQQDTSDGLYDLSSIDDPKVRSEVERIAKDIDRNVNGKLQEAAEYRKGWEAYEELGVNELDPEGLGALLSFAEALNDEETARDALLQLAETVGVDLSGVSPEEDFSDDPIASVQKELEDLRQWRQSQEERELYASVQAEEAQRLEAEWTEVEEAHGKPFTEDEKVRLRDLAIRFVADSEQPIKDAYEFITSVAGHAQSDLVDQAPDQPSPAEPEGQASTAVEPVETFEEAERLMRERREMASAN